MIRIQCIQKCTGATNYIQTICTKLWLDGLARLGLTTRPGPEPRKAVTKARLGLAYYIGLGFDGLTALGRARTALRSRHDLDLYI
ncbi:hypothetical protein PHLCEN_2v12419 [Hermanssonia centrifuga]|uniref:Uncharacterized protein n=1 Tax=Hermanssonia centrifuga TaxID=98765 RepID=A0A2R6NH49_9APHY|nr:hypothetical protein PHLCEN_2v12419 [Hermanssonia centrifuga]